MNSYLLIINICLNFIFPLLIFFRIKKLKKIQCSSKRLSFNNKSADYATFITVALFIMDAAIAWIGWMSNGINVNILFFSFLWFFWSMINASMLFYFETKTEDKKIKERKELYKSLGISDDLNIFKKHFKHVINEKAKYLFINNIDFSIENKSSAPDYIITKIEFLGEGIKISNFLEHPEVEHCLLSSESITYDNFKKNGHLLIEVKIQEFNKYCKMLIDEHDKKIDSLKIKEKKLKEEKKTELEKKEIIKKAKELVAKVDFKENMVKDQVRKNIEDLFNKENIKELDPVSSNELKEIIYQKEMTRF